MTGVNIPVKATRVMRHRMQQDLEDSGSWSSPPLAPKGFWSPRSPEEGSIIKDVTGCPASSELLQSTREEALQARITELEQSLRRVNQLHRSAAKRSTRTVGSQQTCWNMQCHQLGKHISPNFSAKQV